MIMIMKRRSIPKRLRRRPRSHGHERETSPEQWHTKVPKQGP